MAPPFHARAVENRTVGRVLVKYLAFEDAAIFQCEMEHVAVRGVRHGIEADDGHCPVQGLQAVADAPHVAVTTIETPHSVERLALRQFGHT